MSSKYTKITRKKLNIIAKKKGIKEPYMTSTEDLIDIIHRYDSKPQSYSNHRKFRKVGLDKYIKYKISQIMSSCKPTKHVN